MIACVETHKYKELEWAMEKLVSTMGYGGLWLLGVSMRGYHKQYRCQASM
jgi:hypothetical protein